MKIVINSNTHYTKQLATLIKSMIDVGFRRFEALVVVVSQSPVDVPPRKIQLREILPEAPAAEICIIEMAMNSFDYTGYHALHLYKNDPLVAAPCYLYLMDTCTVTPEFNNAYATLRVEKHEVTTCEPPHSNICAFGADVVTSYADNFGAPLTKDEAVAVEFETAVVKDGKEITGILQFGWFVRSGDRVGMDNADIYGTGHLRHRARYPQFGVDKWIFMFKTGDVTGAISDLDLAAHNKLIAEH